MKALHAPTLHSFRSIARRARRWTIAKFTTREWISSWSRPAYIFGSVLVALGLFPYLSGWSTTGLIIMATGLLCVFLAATTEDWLERRLVVRKHCQDDLQMIAGFLNARIDAGEAEKLGHGAPIPTAIARFEDYINRAAVLRVRIHSRVGTGTTFTTEDAEQTHEVYHRFLVQLERLHTHRDQLRAYYAARRAAVGALTSPESDFSLRRELAELRGHARLAEHRVDALIAESVVRIERELAETETKLNQMIERISSTAAAAMTMSEDTDDAIAEMTSTIDAYFEQAKSLTLAPTTLDVKGASS